MKRKTMLLLTMVLGMTTVSGIAAAQTTGEGTTAAVARKYVVVFKQESGLPAGYQQLIQGAGGLITRTLDKLGAVEVTASDANFLEGVKRSALVELAGVSSQMLPDDEMMKMSAVTANDLPATGHFLYEEHQWDIKQVTGNGAAWTMQGGTGIDPEGKPVVIGVIDSGIDYMHPDLKANYLYGKSFVPGEGDPIDVRGHGTHVAGSIAAKGQVMGVGPDLKLAAYKVFGAGGGADSATIAAAIQTAADDQVDVINMSLGGYVHLQDPTVTTKEAVADLKLFDRAIAYAVKKGVTVVGSAGNNGADISKPRQLTQYLFGEEAKGVTFRQPLSSQLIRVSANGKALNRAYYSNYGAGMIDVSAPGGDFGTSDMPDFSMLCLSTYPGGSYAYNMGTSMAAPKAAALAGLIIAKYGKGKIAPHEVKLKMQQSALDTGKPGYDEDAGYGVIQAVNALR